MQKLQRRYFGGWEHFWIINFPGGESERCERQKSRLQFWNLSSSILNLLNRVLKCSFTWIAWYQYIFLISFALHFPNSFLIKHNRPVLALGNVSLQGEKSAWTRFGGNNINRCCGDLRSLWFRLFFSIVIQIVILNYYDGNILLGFEEQASQLRSRSSSPVSLSKVVLNFLISCFLSIGISSTSLKMISWTSLKRFPVKIEIITPLGAADHLPTASPPLLLPDRLLSLPDPHQRRLQPRSIVNSSFTYL